MMGDLFIKLDHEVVCPREIKKKDTSLSRRGMTLDANFVISKLFYEIFGTDT
jgi:hypothetical protein